MTKNVDDAPSDAAVDIDRQAFLGELYAPFQPLELTTYCRNS